MICAASVLRPGDYLPFLFTLLRVINIRNHKTQGFKSQTKYNPQ